MSGTDDQAFETVAKECLAASIAQPLAAQTRLRRIEQPRVLIEQLVVASSAPQVDCGQVNRSLAAAIKFMNAEYPESSARSSSATTSPASTTTTVPSTIDTTGPTNHLCSAVAVAAQPELARVILVVAAFVSSLQALEAVITKGRRSHSQLLSMSPFDSSYVDELAQAIATVVKARDTFVLQIRQDQQVAHLLAKSKHDVCASNFTELVASENIGSAREVIVKWQQEIEPALALKDALQGSDCEVLQRAIAAAQTAGLAVKAAKKRLVRLEQISAASTDLDRALSSGDTAALRTAITNCRSLDMDVEHARSVLRDWLARDSAQAALLSACTSNRPEAIAAAIAQARVHGLDIAAAAKQLERLFEEQREKARKEEEALEARRAQIVSELDTLTADRSTSAIKLAECLRRAKDEGLDITPYVAVLRCKLAHDMQSIIDSGDRDVSLLAEAIDRCHLLDRLNVPMLDTSAAEQTLKDWRQARDVEEELRRATQVALQQGLDESVLKALEDRVHSAKSMKALCTEVLKAAEYALASGKATLRLKTAIRRCRSAHEQACLQHFRSVDVDNGALKEHLVVLTSAIDTEASAALQSVVDDARKQHASWAREIGVVQQLRVAMQQRDREALQALITSAQTEIPAINIEPARRLVQKLNQEQERQTRQAALSAAMAATGEYEALVEAIERARAVGISTSEAAALLTQWQAQVRADLQQATASGSVDSLRLAIEAASRVRLTDSADCIAARRALEEARLGKDRARHPRFKTEMCAHWLAHGSCAYGKLRCNFAHGEDDLRRPSSVPTTPNSANASLTDQSPPSPSPSLTRTTRLKQPLSPELRSGDASVSGQKPEPSTALPKQEKATPDPPRQLQPPPALNVRTQPATSPPAAQQVSSLLFPAQAAGATMSLQLSGTRTPTAAAAAAAAAGSQDRFVKAPVNSPRENASVATESRRSVAPAYVSLSASPPVSLAPAVSPRHHGAVPYASPPGGASTVSMFASGFGGRPAHPPPYSTARSAASGAASSSSVLATSPNLSAMPFRSVRKCLRGVF
jgi:hypothetical protein